MMRRMAVAAALWAVMCGCSTQRQASCRSEARLEGGAVSVTRMSGVSRVSGTVHGLRAVTYASSGGDSAVWTADSVSLSAVSAAEADRRQELAVSAEVTEAADERTLTEAPSAWRTLKWAAVILALPALIAAYRRL